VRAPQTATAGTAVVRLSFEGWPEGNVQSAEFELPVVPRKTVAAVAVSPRQTAVWRLGDGWQLKQLAMTPIGKDLVVVSRRRQARSGDSNRLALWDLASAGNRRLVLDLQPEPKLSSWINRLEFSRDGRWLAVNQVRQGGIQKNPQGEEVYVAANRVHLIELTSGKVAATLETPGCGVLGIAFSPDGQSLATAQLMRVDRREGERSLARFDGDVRIWEVATGRLLRTFPAGPAEGPHGVAFAPNGKTLAAWFLVASPDRKEDRTLTKLWSWPEGAVRATLSDEHEVQFLAAGQRLIAQGRKGTLLLHTDDNESPRVLLQFDRANRWLRHVRASVDGGSVFCCFDDGQLVKLELPSGKVLVERPAPARPDTNRRFWSWAQSNDGRLFALSEHTELPHRAAGTLPEEWEEVSPPEIHVWDTTTLRLLATLTGHVGRVNDLAFTPDGRTLLSGGTDGTVRRWDLSDLVQTGK
jgi:WD40 repeat protein